MSFSLTSIVRGAMVAVSILSAVPSYAADQEKPKRDNGHASRREAQQSLETVGAAVVLEVAKLKEHFERAATTITTQTYHHEKKLDQTTRRFARETKSDLEEMKADMGRAYYQALLLTADERVATYDYLIHQLDAAAEEVRVGGISVKATAAVASVVSYLSLMSLRSRVSVSRLAFVTVSIAATGVAIASNTHPQQVLGWIHVTRKSLVNLRTVAAQEVALWEN